MGRAEAMHRAARAFLVDAMTELMEATDGRGERLVKARVAFRLAGSFAAETATRIVEMLAGGAGSASILETCRLERAVRDAHAAARHVAMSPNNYIVGGKLALGLDVSTARF